MRRALTIVLLGCLVTAGFAPAVGTAVAQHATTPAPSAGSAAPAANNSTTLTLLSYNDVQTAAAEDTTLPRMATLVEQRRAAHDNPVVLAGGGDQVSPHALSPVSEWRVAVDSLNEMDPAADVVGNHDLDYGFAAVENYSAASEFPWLAANLIDESTGEPIAGAEAYHVVERQGVRVGFVGLVDDAIKGKTAVDFDEAGVRVADFREVGPEIATTLKEEENVDVVVALAHVGIPESEELAHASENVDVVVAGDDEVRYPPQEVSGTVITEAVARAEYLGELNLTVEGGDVTAWNGRLIEVTDDVPKDPTVSSIINDYRSEVSLDSVAGVTETPLDARFSTNYHRESGMGNLITDAMRWETDADVAITNAGGIRSNRIYGPGNVTGGDVFNVLPFSNTVVVVELTGAELRETLESQIVTLESGGGQIFGAEPAQQVAGVRFEWVGHEGVDRKVRDVYVNGERLDPDATYEVAVNSYIAGGGSGYPLADEPRLERTGKLLATTVVDYLEAKGTVAPEPEGRMQRVDRDLADASIRVDGNGKVVLRFDAPADYNGTVAGTWEVSTKGDRTVAAEKVVYDEDEGNLVVRFDDGRLATLVQGSEEVRLDLYGGYHSDAFDRVYFEFSRLNADLTATVAGSASGQGNQPSMATPAPVAAT